MKSKIVAAKFTWSLPEGLWVRYEDGVEEWIVYADLKEELSQTEFLQVNRVAHNNGISGMWHPVPEVPKVSKTKEEVEAIQTMAASALKTGITMKEEIVVTLDQFMAYEHVRIDRRYNMLSPGARKTSNLPDDVYMEILKNYAKYKGRFLPKSKT